MLTFAGEGYSPAFVRNFEQILDRLRGGEPIELVDGPDDVCEPLCEASGPAAHCRTESIAGRDALAGPALAKIPELGPLFAGPGEAGLEPAVITQLRTRFAAGSIRGACHGCEWSALCSRIATEGYARAFL